VAVRLLIPPANKPGLARAQASVAVRTTCE
jgi:hypothetical protein